MGMMDMVRDWFAPARGRNVMPPDIRADFMRGNRGVVFGGWRPALREAADDVGASWDLASCAHHRSHPEFRVDGGSD